MQDRYVGDVGDFGKYGLLRFLCADLKLKLGVVWYLVDEADDKTRNADGKHIRYLTKDRMNLRSCDSSLYDRLRKMVVQDKERSVEEVEKRNILLPGTVFYRKPIAQGKASRKEWFREALQEVENCDIVFLDPDNGIAGESNNSIKHASLDEIKELFDGHEKSLIVYHHCGRHKTAREQITELRRRVKDRLRQEPFVLWYHRGTARFFFIVPSKKHKFLKEKLDLFQDQKNCWITGRHFTYEG